LQHDRRRADADGASAAGGPEAAGRAEADDRAEQPGEPRRLSFGYHAGEGIGPRVPLPADEEAGRYSTINDLAAAEKINSFYVSRLLRLTLLAPDIEDAILNGQQPEGMTLPGLMEPFPVEWEGQPQRSGNALP
jgi:hypothetical protein